jgi:chromosomal replication initiator protein
MNTLWEEAKNRVRSEVTEQGFSLWIRPLSVVESDGDTLILECPNKFSKNWVQENYGTLLQEKLQEVGGSNLKILFRAGQSGKQVPPADIELESRQMAFPNMRRRRGIMTGPWLNSSLTFERFVVGKCNEFAYSVSLSMASGSEMLYTPLLMLANTGLGKSHLTQAIGHAILSREPDSRVCYITTEDFVNEMIFALRNNRIEEFKNKYRRACDVLLLEEVHFLSGKEKTQKELEYTLDALANDRKKIIFTSSLLPKDIPDMSKGMESRLTSGIITRMGPPDYDTRVNIIQRKAAEQNVNLSDEAVGLLAKHLCQDVRQMESALTCLKAKSELLHERISKDLVMEVIKCHVSEGGAASLEDIKALLCKYFNVDADLLASRSRKKVYSYPRNVYAYLCRQHTDATLEEIGSSINRKHSTVLYASEVIASKIKVDRGVRKQVEFLSQKIQEGKK